MKIGYLDIADAEKLTRVYNNQFEYVPHCYAVSPDEFMAGFPYHKYARGSYNEDIHSEKLIFAEQNGEIAGFADVAIAEVQETCKGFIRFLTYQAGFRSIGQAILEESERYLTNMGVKQIKAFRLNTCSDHCGYHFYHLGYSMISDRMGHICALFAMNGYEKSGGEIFMNWRGYNLPEPTLPDKKVEIVIKQETPEQAALPGLNVRAFLDERQIGDCISISAGEFCKASEAQDWVFISGLGVEAAEQGKGWGRYLLQRNLWEMRKIGYKNTVISTDWENFRAQLFYTNYGYQVADTNYELSKEF